MIVTKESEEKENLLKSFRKNREKQIESIAPR